MEKFLQRWVETGMISKEKHLELLSDVLVQKEKRAKIRTQVTLYLIGALLLGIGVILFISANDWIIKLLEECYILQIVLLSVLTFASLFFGNRMLENNTKFPRLAQSLVFLSAILIGAVYALLGQIYNIEANSALIYFVWFISIIPLAFMFKSNAINILSGVVFIIGSCCYFSFDNSLSVLIPLLLGSLFYISGNISVIKEKFEHFSLTYKTIGLAFIFISLLIFVCTSFSRMHFEPLISYVTASLVLIAFNLLNYFSNKKRDALLKSETIYITVLLFFSLLFISGTISVLSAFLAHIFIITKIWFLYYVGYKDENIKFITLANRFLIIYLIINYIKFGSEYFKGATFFIIGGVLLFSLGLYFEKKQRFLSDSFKGKQNEK